MATPAAPELDLAPLRSTKAASGFKGVTPAKSKTSPWQARTIHRAAGQQRSLGSFKTVDEAARAVAAALRDGPNWTNPKAERAPRGLVSLFALPVCIFLPGRVSLL